QSKPEPQECSRLLGGADHMILYHYVTSGRVLARLADAEPVEFEAGQVIILPHNNWHLMGSQLDLKPVPTKEIVQAPSNDCLATINHGGGGEPTRIVCGFLGCDKLEGNPLAEA